MRTTSDSASVAGWHLCRCRGVIGDAAQAGVVVMGWWQRRRRARGLRHGVQTDVGAHPAPLRRVAARHSDKENARHKQCAHRDAKTQTTRRLAPPSRGSRCPVVGSRSGLQMFHPRTRRRLGGTARACRLDRAIPAVVSRHEHASRAALYCRAKRCNTEASRVSAPSGRVGGT